MLPDDVLIETTCDGGVPGTCDPAELRRAVRVKICDESTPPVPVDVNVVRCGGAVDIISAVDAPSTQVVISGSTQPIPVCIQGEKDFAEVYKCDANTGNTILIRTVLDHDTNTYVTTYYDLVVGADWAGSPATDLTECTSNALESDQVIGCDGGVQVVQWIVKDNGEPTGVVYYTDISGAIVTPVAWTPGECPVAEVTRTVDVIDDCAGTTTTETVADRIQEVIINGSVKPIDVRIKESCVVESRVDVEYLKLCDDTGATSVPFIRRVERTYSVSGALISEVLTDTEIDLVTAYVVVGTVVFCQPENPIDFEQRCVQDSTLPVAVKGIELRERLANGTYAVVGYVEQDGITSWSPVLPVSDCTDVQGTTPVELCVVEPQTIALDISTSSVAGNVVTIVPDTTGSTQTIVKTVIDWGSGVVSYNTPLSNDYSSFADGSYVIQVQVTDALGASLIQAVAVDVLAGVPTLGTFAAAKVNNYEVVVQKVFRSYDSTGLPVYTVDVDGTPFVPAVGQLVKPCDDCECSSKPCESFCFSSEGSGIADIVDCTTIVGANVVTEGLDANLIAASEVATGGGGTITTYHTMLGNPGLNLAGTASGGGGAIVGGLNVNVGTAITGAQFTYTVNVGSDSDPGDPADLAVVVWDNVAGTSVTATSIVTALPYSGFDPQGTGLNYPIYAYPNPIVNPYTIVWTGDLPVGDYTVVFLNQNQGITDNVTVSIAHNIVAGGTPVVTKAQLMALDECTIAALTPEPVIPPIEVPGGAIIVNTAALSVIAPANVRSFSVKGLANKTYDISFDSGTNWLNTIDGGDSWGEGNEYQIDISQVLVRPTVSGDRVFIHWEVI
jgi:hypothetical protein